MPHHNLDSECNSNTLFRAITQSACEALRPFFDLSNQWGGQSQDHLAYQTLKEHFPELTSQDAFITVSTVKRMVASGKALPGH